MKVYYIADAAGALFHDKVFTTAQLAIGYLAEDDSLNYAIGRWTDKNTGEVVARLRVAVLCVE